MHSFTSSTAMIIPHRAASHHPCCSCGASPGDGTINIVSHDVQFDGPTMTSRRSFFSLITIGASLTSPLSISISARHDATILEQLQQPSPVIPTSISFNRSLLAANAAETIGKDDACNDATCLGVWDGLLADCPHDKRSSYLLGGGKGAGCVSSQDDTPGIFAEPWDYSENVPLTPSGDNGADDEKTYNKQMDQLILALESISRQHGDELQIMYQEGRYIRVLFTDGSTDEKSVGEFYFTPHDTTVQFRLGSTTTSVSPSSVNGVANMFGRSLSNMERSERLRKALRYLKVPVLRNRKRALFFVESELDGFGPGSAALGPPEEMSPGELIGK